ncbi:MAG: hypothetical protein JNL70_09355 [Saprospiraceae bacterium]|nr:hypothetical protein [Saprospiraceae bacterium]
MENNKNVVKIHESSVKSADQFENVNAILSHIANTPFALRGVKTKTIFYFLFSLIAAAEMAAAFFFQISALGFPIAVVVALSLLLPIVFHGLLHNTLVDTALGIVFVKRKESGAMASEVTSNIILSIALLLGAACTVFFVGKKGFSNYRAIQYEKKINDDKSKLPPIQTVDATMLTNKNGKIAAWKLEALADLEKAKATTIEKQTEKEVADRAAYDATTAQITDIVGVSAFALEFLLALLAYSIATAKKAAVMEELVQRQKMNGEPFTANVKQQALMADTDSANTAPPSVQKFGFSENNGRTVIRGFQRQNDLPTANVEQQALTTNTDKSKMKVCLHCETEYVYKIHNQKYCSENCRIAAWEARTGKKFSKPKG